MKIIESTDWSTYKYTWKECMKDYYWYQTDPVFDWNKNEELDDMEDEFGKPGNVFLEAHQDDKIVGVFSFRYRGKEAKMMRWEPAVLKASDDNEIRSALLSYAMDYLSGKGVEHTKVVMKYPIGNPDIAKPLLDLYQQSGFSRYQPDSVDLITSLDDMPSPPSMPKNVSIDRDLGLIPENIGAYCVRAYGTTPADIEIHGFDKSVTEYESAVSIANAILGGRFGR
ncbi:hypothetical protein EU528_14665, partial [Candidatus Thorarchaeota archaeon]